MMASRRRIITLLAVLLVAAIALGLRLRAVDLLPIDYDEDDYLAVAQRYAQFAAAGDVRAIVDYGFNYGHPPLTKLTYGLALLPLPAAPLIPEQTSPNIPPARSLPEPHFHAARTLSAVTRRRTSHWPWRSRVWSSRPTSIRGPFWRRWPS